MLQQQPIQLLLRLVAAAVWLRAVQQLLPLTAPVHLPANAVKPAASQALARQQADYSVLAAAAPVAAAPAVAAAAPAALAGGAAVLTVTLAVQLPPLPHLLLPASAAALAQQAQLQKQQLLPALQLF
jgi:hypothetical protein